MTDRETFERIFRAHYGEMFRLARRLLGDDCESKDVVSDVFAQLLHDGVVLREETIRAFLLTTVRHRSINLLIRRQREQTALTALKASSAVADTHQQSTVREQLDALRRFIDEKLSPLSQQVVRLRYEQGLKYREIAQVLGISEVSVHNHLSQSLSKMKFYFKDKRL